MGFDLRGGHRAGHQHLSASPRRRESPAFLKQAERAFPTTELHLVMETTSRTGPPRFDYGWQSAPWIHVHLTSRVSVVESLVDIWFGIFERQAIRRRTFTSVEV